MQLKDKISDLTFRIYRIIGRLLIKYSNNPRPHSLPFITGDGFRQLANHIYDNTTKLDPATVKDGDIIFVGDSNIGSFVSNIHPKLSARYVLITHNGDAPVTKTLLDQVRPKLIKWYGINVEVDNEQVIPIPLGIENKHYFVCGIPALFKKVMRTKREKKDKIFYAFTVVNNPVERQPALAEIQKNHCGETLTYWRGFRAYLIHLNQFKFVLSPPGSSVEGHRTWDTLYIGGIPIVKSSITTRYFKKIGLPLLVLENWSELQNLTEETIPKTYHALKQTEKIEPLYMPYWSEKILADTKL